MNVRTETSRLLGRNCLNSKQAKQKIKQEILRRGWTVVRRIGKVYIVKGPTPNFVCTRWYGWAVCVDSNEMLDQLLRDIRDA